MLSVDWLSESVTELYSGTLEASSLLSKDGMTKEYENCPALSIVKNGLPTDVESTPPEVRVSGAVAQLPNPLVETRKGISADRKMIEAWIAQIPRDHLGD